VRHRRPLVLALLLAGLAPAAEFTVAPGGRDTHPGTRQRPFATLARARRAVRGLVAGGLEGDVTVWLREGIYELPAPLVFGPGDSGAAEHAITYAAMAGETAAVSGGRRIRGWRPGKGKLWTAHVPEAKAGTWRFRQLFVDGRRATRARTPNLGCAKDTLRLTGAALSKDLRTYTLSLPEGTVRQWRNVADVEFVGYGVWEVVRKRLLAANAAAHTVTLAPPHINAQPANRPKAGMPCRLENAAEMLDAPGEWHLDRATGLLTYWPLAGQDMSRCVASAPALTRLVEVRGTAARPVRNLHFRGIAFEQADWTLPPMGYFGAQACVRNVRSWAAMRRDWLPESRERMDAALRWDFARRCSLRDGQVAHVEGVGLALRKGCCHNTVEGNRFVDIGGNAVAVGEVINFYYYRDPSFTVPRAEVPVGNRIANNHIHHCGVCYHGAVGVHVALTEGTVVAHNLIEHLPYTGISCGWCWRTLPTICKANRIEHNHIHHVMEWMNDGGGIYTLGSQPGTVVRGNHVHDNPGVPGGIYLDQGSSHIEVAGNLVYGVRRWINYNNRRDGGFPTCRVHDNFPGPRPGGVARVPGKLGRAAHFDGMGSSVYKPHAPELEPDHLTLEAWVRLGKLPAGKDRRKWIISKNANELADGHYALTIRGDTAGAYLNFGGGNRNKADAWSPAGAIRPGRWHHLAMTYDGTDLKVYVDAALVASRTVGRKRSKGKGELRIAQRVDGFTTLEGDVDEARVYSRALPAAELKAHAADPAAASTRGLVAHWSFEAPPAVPEEVQEVIDAAGPEPRYRTRLLPQRRTEP